MSTLDLKTLPEPLSKYKLGLKLGGGLGGEVYEALESQTGKKVAIKVIDLEKDSEDEIQREYNVLKQFSGSECFPEFYGIYAKKGRGDEIKVWLVMELCEGGDATTLVRKLKQECKPMSELHIAYIMREAIKESESTTTTTVAVRSMKAVIVLHENNISHRDIRGSNILLTADGRVKLIDYGISKRVDENRKMKTCLGSASWMAPEVITSQTEGAEGYDKKADVWALGITAIELGDGQGPFEDMHPGRALFQVVNNPPPTLRKPSEWSQLYRDFIGECLVKIPENRPYVQELLIHPFFELLNKEENFLQDFTALVNKHKDIAIYKAPEVQVRKGFMRTEKRTESEKILQEDLAAMARVSEDSTLFQLHERLKKKEIHTFIGDILLILNSNKISDDYGTRYHNKYKFKAKSENAPHIYSIADSAYRDVFHHEKPQHILFAGETGAGKTANMKHAIDHLLFLGEGLKSSEKVPKAMSVVHFMGNAATPHNPDSTRHILQTQLTFTDTGKTSGAVFRVYLLEKERLTMTPKKQSNFHLFYYFYDALRSQDKLEEFYLNKINYKFLKVEQHFSEDNCKKNAVKFQIFEDNLRDLGFEEEHILAVKKILSAVLLIGEIEFLDDKDGNGALATPEIVNNVAALLGADHKKLSWALLNYCLIVNGEAIMRHNSRQEAEEARNVLAKGLYSRLVDWVVNTMNEKISVSRVVYGDRHIISLLDFYGFECYKKNTLNQLLVNSINEQLQFHYNQHVFTWDKQTAEEEEIQFPNVEFNDNKTTLDFIMSKPEGILYKIDEATRNEDPLNFLDSIKSGKETPIFPETCREFSINHYTGKITYDVSDMIEKNRDFLPPEIIDTMRLSTQDVIKQMFSSLLSKSGNLSSHQKSRGSAARSTENRVSTTPTGQYSQSRQMRTAATTFRAACADLFKTLTVRESGFHFVRCMRTDLSRKPGAFDPEIIRQQLRALSVVDTILITQQGYSYSVSHVEFIRRYRFLAFDFDENVEETKDNCRLLLLRLKLEGWAMGKTKVFLKYFNKEYLSRLYEMQIKKIVKVQSMMRTFMARRKLRAKIRRYQIEADEKKIEEEEHDLEMEARAAMIIQKRFREYAANRSNLTENEKDFIRPWYKRWRTKSIFQVLLLFRAERLQALVNFCLQIHLYNQNILSEIQKTKDEINMEDVKLVNETIGLLSPLKPSIPKLLFTWESLQLKGDITNCEPLPYCDIERLQSEDYTNLIEKKTEPLYRFSTEKVTKNFKDKEIQTSLGNEEIESQNEEEDEEAIPDYPIPLESKKPENENRDNSTEQRNETLNSEATLSLIIPKEQEKPKNENSENPMAERDKSTDREETKNVIQKQLLPKKNEYTEYNNTTSRRTFYTPPSSLKNQSMKVNSEKKFTTSINEMEEKFRNKSYTEGSEDPPFNFRALLKKPNPIKNSDKSLTREFDFQTEIKNFKFSQRKMPPHCEKFQQSSDPIELAPGILIYGKVVDL